ncbi:hypothetical protein FFR93_16055 [Rhizobium sp. MHM7A]|nr:hypothetical protein [Rhizobium sp. MHM7A]TLX12084.1 hypothetical protein FFR93_16055 [Rhizobium sp. MHM7A]
MRKEAMRIDLGTTWRQLFRVYSVKRLGRFADSVGRKRDNLVDAMRPVFELGRYEEVLGLVEWLARNCKDLTLARSFARIMEEERCAYRLLEGAVVPISSEEEGRAIYAALDAMHRPGLGGARVHLLKAGSSLTAGEYADSVRESIHAVESVARSLTGEASLLKALTEISKGHPMHPALRSGFNSIYGYTSDANGIRHPMIGDEAAMVGEAEAIFMLSSCAAFVTYLINVTN